MSSRIKFYLRYTLFWVGFAVITRLLFLGYRHDLLVEMQANLFSEMLLKGLKMDLAMASYILVFPFLLSLCFEDLSNRYFRKLTFYYSIFTATILSLISVSDMEIFSIWGFRIDASALHYLCSPKEAFASSCSSPILMLGWILILLVIFSLLAYKKIVHLFLTKIGKSHSSNLEKWISSTAILALMVIAGRGGFCNIPLNPSYACFSDNDFANQAAINIHWSFFRTLLEGVQDKGNPYKYFSSDEAEQNVKAAYQPNPPKKVDNSINSNLPNVILIIWESFSASAVEVVGGEAGVTSGFNRLAKEGLLFSNIYATGDRTGKGLVGVLSGYPAQPRSEIISSTRKAFFLPNLGKSLKNAGYQTSFYYGGDINFDNMKNYLFHGGFDRIFDEKSFSAKIPRSKWGVHDHNVLDLALEHIERSDQQFFSVILTLSSHEPFEVPDTSVFSGNDKVSKYKNALAYTDRAITGFIEKIEQLPCYQNSLIIVVADHGTSYIGHPQRYEPEKYHIPLLFMGGALDRGSGVITKIGSQQDIAKTLLEILQLNSDEFVFSRNLFLNTSSEFACCFFNDGFSMVTKSGYMAFDNSSNRLLHRDKTISDDFIKLGKMIMQTSYQDYLDKGERLQKSVHK